MRRSATVAVCLAVFVDMLGFGIILPSLPLHAAGLGGGGVWVGALLTAYAAAQSGSSDPPLAIAILQPGRLF